MHKTTTTIRISLNRARKLRDWPVKEEIEKSAEEDVGPVRIRQEEIGEGELARALDVGENLLDPAEEFDGANGFNVEIRVFKML